MSLASMGYQGLLDATSTFFGGQGDVYYRTQNFPPEQNDAVEIGLPVPNPAAGTTDTPICPTPDVVEATLRNISDAVIAGVNILEGSQIFNISQTWVQQIQQARNYELPEQVFNDPTVVGLIYNSKLYSIVSYKPSYVFGSISVWTVIGNATSLG